MPNIILTAHPSNVPPRVRVPWALAIPILTFFWMALAGTLMAELPSPLPPSPPRPGSADGPTKVFVTAWFADISRIDSVSQTFSCNLVLVLRWKDPTLVREGSETKTYDINSLWHPRWLIANEGDSLRRSLPETVDVTPDGTVVYRQRLVGSFSQSFNFRRFPFDHDTFRIKLVALGMLPKDLEFLPDPTSEAHGVPNGIGASDKLTMQDWKVVGYTANSAPYLVAPGVEIAGYSLEFTADRLVQHYLLKVLLPLLLIVFMSWTVFWIDPTNGGPQISVAVTSMLTLIAYRFAIGADVPKLPYLTRFDLFIMLSTLLVFASLIEVMFTTAWATAGKVEQARNLDRRCRWIFPLAFVCLIGISFLKSAS